MKMVWDESVIGRNRFWMKVSLDETVFEWKCHWMNPFLDESVVDEIVFSFGRKCFWTKVFLDEGVFGWVFFFFCNLDESVPNRNQSIQVAALNPLFVLASPTDNKMWRVLWKFSVKIRRASHCAPRFPLRSADSWHPRKIAGNTFLPNWNLRQIFLWTQAMFNHCSERSIGPSNGSPNRFPQGVFPSARRSWTFRKQQ